MLAALMTSGPNRSASWGGLALRALLGLGVAAVALTFADVLTVRLVHPYFVPSGAELAELGLAASGLHALVVAVGGCAALIASGAWLRAGRWSRAVVGGLALGGGVALLNAELATRQRLLVIGLVLAVTVGTTVWARALMVERRSVRLPLVGASIAGAVLLLWANSTVLALHYPRQHATMTLLAVVGLAAPIAAVAPNLDGASTGHGGGRKSGLAAVVCLLAAALYFVQMSGYVDRAENRLRTALRQLSPNASAVLLLATPLLETDGDGSPALYGGGDCSPFDASVAPFADERAGDGVDGNCFAGDPGPQDVSWLVESMRGSPPTVDAPLTTNALLVTIDALRYDVDLPQTMAALQGRCTRFTHAYAVNPRTTFSMFGLFTSRFPGQQELGLVGEFWVPNDDTSPTLAGVLSRHGVSTGAAGFNHIFDVRYGITRGFSEVWVDSADQRVVEGIAAPTTLAMASSWLARQTSPFLLWAHFYDPHEPYLVHEGGPHAAAPARVRYEGEVAFTDDHLRRLIESLGEAVADTFIVITGDHGEAFGEHGSYFHNNTLYDEEVRVPLFVCPPPSVEVPRPTGPVSLLDVAPTLLHAFAIPPPDTFMGRSLLESREPAPVFAQTLRSERAMEAVVSWPYKLLRYSRSNTFLMFDLAADPGERIDLSASHPAELEALQLLLDGFLALDAQSGSTPGN